MHPTSENTVAYQSQIDGLRLLCFLGVFAFHCWMERLWFFNYFLPVYLVLSGFVITQVLLASEGYPLRYRFQNYYARRILRIFPAYYFILIVLFLVDFLDFPLWKLTYLFNFKIFLISLSGNLDAFEHWQDTGIHFWSLCIDEQFYLTYPLFILFIPPLKRVRAILGAIAGCVLVRLYFWKYHPTLWYGTLTFVNGEYLLWGALISMLDKNRQKDFNWPRISVGAFLMLILLVGCQAQISTSPLNCFQPGLFLTFFAVVISILIWAIWNDRKSFIFKFLSLRPLVYFGKMSYGLYLIHLFTWRLRDVIVARYPYLREVPAPLGRLVLTFLLALMLWHFVEQPFLRLKRYFIYYGS